MAAVGQTSPVPIPTQPPQHKDFALLRAALTPPAGTLTADDGALTAGSVRTQMNGLGYAEGQVDYFVDGDPAATRTFCIGRNTALNVGVEFYEGLAIAFDVFPAFRGQGIARVLPKQLVSTLKSGAVERILVKADRDGRAVWQRYYDWDFEQASSNASYLHTALFATHPRQPLTPEQQERWRAQAIRLARGRIPRLPLRMRAFPRRQWSNTYDAQLAVSTYLMATHPICGFSELEPHPEPVSRLLSSVNWHGVVHLSERSAIHNETLRKAVLANELKPPLR